MTASTCTVAFLPDRQALSKSASLPTVPTETQESQEMT